MITDFEAGRFSQSPWSMLAKNTTHCTGMTISSILILKLHIMNHFHRRVFCDQSQNKFCKALECLELMPDFWST